jgi:hypothetical protein
MSGYRLDNSRTRRGQVLALLSLLMLMPMACAAPRGRAPVALRQPNVMAAQGAPDLEIVIYGDVLESLEPPPRHDRLHEFLYGPEPDAALPLLRHPQGLLVHGGQVFVGDQGFPDVLRIDPVGGTVRRWTDRPSRPACPVDLAGDGAGRVIVADTTLRAVLIYGPDGRVETTLYGPGVEEAAAATWRPTAVLVHEDVLFIADGLLPGVHRYELAAGAWMSPVPVSPTTPAMVGPTGLAMTPDGVLLVADSISGVVHRIGRDGQPMRPLGVRGRGFGEFVRPMHVATTPAGWIVVTDAARQTVQVYAADGRCVVEIGRQRGGFRGFTLPLGVTGADSLAASVAQLGWPAVDGAGEELLLVSDALGLESLTLIGLRRKGSP